MVRLNQSQFDMEVRKDNKALVLGPRVLQKIAAIDYAKNNRSKYVPRSDFFRILVENNSVSTLGGVYIE